MLILRRVNAVIVGTLISALAYTAVPAVADPSGTQPVVVTPGYSGTVNIGVVAPGGDVNGGGSKDLGVRIDSQTNACAADAGSAGCSAYQRANFCSAIAGDWAGGMQTPSLNSLSPVQFAGVNAVLAGVGCPPLNAGGPAPPTAVELAQSAYGQLKLPAPVPSRYPEGTLRDGRPYTVVNTYMWFWSDASVWRQFRKRVCAGALCATATAKPTTLSLDPGNGDQAVSCPGPGTAWVEPANGAWVPPQQPQGCDYRYLKSTFGYPNGELTATYSITWTVTWTGTNGTSGALNPLTTTAASIFAVAELQAVVIQ